MNFTTQLRQAAVRCKEPKLAAALRVTAQNLEHAVRELWRNPTENNMVIVNGLWAVGHRCKQEAAKDASLWGSNDEPTAA